jgi:hypothetical protein
MELEALLCNTLPSEQRALSIIAREDFFIPRGLFRLLMCWAKLPSLPGRARLALGGVQMADMARQLERDARDMNQAMQV